MAEYVDRVLRLVKGNGTTVWGWYIVPTKDADTSVDDLWMSDIIAYGNAMTRWGARRRAARALRNVEAADFVRPTQGETDG